MSIAGDMKVLELERRIKKLESDVELLLSVVDKQPQPDVSRGTQPPKQTRARN